MARRLKVPLVKTQENSRGPRASLVLYSACEERANFEAQLFTEQVVLMLSQKLGVATILSRSTEVFRELLTYSF